MTVAAYTTDLTDIADLDTTGGTAVEPDSLWTAGRSPEEADTDNPIQGTVHASLTMNTTGKCGVLVPGETGWASGDYIFGWIIWLAPGAIATYASGGLAMILGDSASVFDVFYVGGKDYGLYPIGGWQNFVVDPTMTPDENAGTPTAYSYVGAGANVSSAVSKGAPLMFDVFRYGRGEARIVGGTSTDADASFEGLAAVNDNNSNMWGLFQEIIGGYVMKGKLIIGYGAACNFTDSGKSINIDRTDWVDADFNRIEITNASSVINWTNINITCIDPDNTASKGRLEMMDDAEFNDTGGVFEDMDTFIYDSNYTGTNRTWRRCGQVTQGGGTFTLCKFDESSAAVALVVDDLSKVTGCNFVSDGAGHAVNLGTFSDDATIGWNNTHSGYALAAGTDANKVILVNVAATKTLTINVTGGNSPTVYNTGTGTVDVQSAVDVTVTVYDSSTGNELQYAHVLLLLKSDYSTQVLNDTTDVDGEATTQFNYASDVEVVGWVRQMDISGVDYVQKDVSGIITSNGLSLSVELDPIT